MNEGAVWQRADWPWVAGLIAIVLLLLAGALVDERAVLGGPGTDNELHFYASRSFGFREMAAGRLAGWNPHTYSGAPYLGAMQAALLYPPNLIFLALPPALGINWSIAIHLCLVAGLTFAWARMHGVSREGGFLAGCMAALGGGCFLHVYAGHLSNLCTMAWAPMVFMAIDGIVATVPRRRYRSAAYWCLMGIVGVGMQVFAGHPQYLFYTAVAAVLYSALRVGVGFFTDREGPPKAAVSQAWPASGNGRNVRGFGWAGLALCTLYPLGAALGAAQLLPGIATSAETIRSAPVPFSFASMFGFPPENLLTIVAPTVFGDMKHVPYWGRCYLWEMCLYVGVVGAGLAAYAAWPRGERQAGAEPHRAVVPLCMIGLLLLLALGNNTPLFSLLYHHVPGFGKFRGISKFAFQASLFIALLGGMGYDRLKRDGAAASFRAAVFIGAALGLTAGVLVLFADFGPVLRAMLASQESYLPPAALTDPGFLRQARLGAAQALLAAGATAAAFGALVHVLPKHEAVIHLVLGLAVGELGLFAAHGCDRSPVGNVPRPEIVRFLAEHPGEYRVLDLTNPDAAMAGGYHGIWGYAPDLTRRYGELIAFTQDVNPDEATPYVNFTRIDPLYKMLRLKYGFLPGEQGIRVVEASDPLPRVLLVPACRVLADRDAIFAALRDPAFDPSREVILEEEPNPAPGAGSRGSGRVHVVSDTGDTVTIEAETDAPAILVVTDTYASGWKARPLSGSAQADYHLLPANYALRAIPLAAGRHSIVMEYRPPSFRVGAWVSALTAVGLGLAAVFWWRSAPVAA